MRQALRLAARGFGLTSPNPMVGAVIVQNGAVIGQGWHHRAGLPHAEVEALNNARAQGHSTVGATLYVTLEPCCTHGRTPPCTGAILEAGIAKVIIATLDPNPAHSGRGVEILRAAGVTVECGPLGEESARLNEAFNHWIVHKTPWITVKAAMSLDGKIATTRGQSKWITGEKSRSVGMKLRLAADAILVGANTILADNPSLTLRLPSALRKGKRLRRIVLDPLAVTPLTANIILDANASLTTLVSTASADKARVEALAEKVTVWTAPDTQGWIDLPWLLQRLGAENITHLLVEGGGETNASFLLPRLAHRIAFFYAPMILGGRTAPKGVSGDGVSLLDDRIRLEDVTWRRLGVDLLLTARLVKPSTD
jgi:diaminohydroxyphosphoribosylaminopyrimidine deaminase/5-amino-6-(5-phosphoribosylamino)uracil reductase